VASLISGRSLVDPTLFEHGGLWWLLCGDGNGDGHALHAWYADTPLGPWRPHRNSPIKPIDRCSRPGGTPFMHRGRLFRPAQDGTRTYGGRVVIYEVTALDPDQFSERIAAVIEPDRNGPFPNGLHTISAAGDVTLIDSKRYMFSPTGFVRGVRAGVARMLGDRNALTLG
jgi:hypothetical protein